MNSGPNQPSGNGGGRGRRRRRGRRGHGGGQPSQGQPQGQNTQQAQGQGGGQQHGGPRPHQGQNQGGPRGQQQRRFKPRRQNRGPVNQRTPDAGIYSAPMDHSYRQVMGDDFGNGNGTSRPRPSNGSNGDAPSATPAKPIYAFVDDLFFLAKIQETARKLGVKVDFVKAEKEVLDNILGLEEKPSLIIFDLNSNSGKPLVVIPKLKAKLKKDTNIIGFLSHIQGDLKVKAMEAGCDMVVPRSAFSQNLPNILRRHASDGQMDDNDAQPSF